MKFFNRSFLFYYLFFFVLLLATIILAVRTGAVPISYHDIFKFVFEPGNHAVNQLKRGVFLQIRLPRVLLCIVVGASLSVSGALMQALFRNPIVAPGLIGTSAGAALGAALVFVLGSAFPIIRTGAFGSFMLPFSAFVGAFLATFIVYKVSSTKGKTAVAIMLLVGIAMNALCLSGTGFLSYIARDPQARSITFWSLGTFSGADWKSFYIVGICTLLCILISLRYSKELNALLLGEGDASHLGVNPDQLILKIMLINTLMVAVATSFVGVIGFVGLIVPHVLRIIKSSDNYFLIIGSALLGAIVMNVADIVSRIIIAPGELPIGIITSFVGAPIFMWMLFHQKRKSSGGGFYA